MIGSVLLISPGVYRGSRWILFICDLVVPGVAIEGYDASCLASLQGMDFNWNVWRQSGTELYLPKMRTFVQGWAISPHQVLSLDATELNRDVGSLEGAGILWNVYILLRGPNMRTFDLNSSVKSILFDLIIWISHQNLKLGAFVQFFFPWKIIWLIKSVFVQYMWCLAEADKGLSPLDGACTPEPSHSLACILSWLL